MVRVVTPGTLTEDSLLDARRHNYLAALAEAEGRARARLARHVDRRFPRPAGRAGAARRGLGAACAGRAAARRPPVAARAARRGAGRLAGRADAAATSRFDSDNGRRRLEALYKVKALDAFGALDRAELAASGALVDYVELTQKGRLPHIAPPRRLRRRHDPGDRPGDAAQSGAQPDAERGTARQPARHHRPHRHRRRRAPARRSSGGAAQRARGDRAPARYGGVLPRRHARRATALRAILKRAPDLERALSRLTLGRGGPRDLAAMRDGLGLAPDLRRRSTGRARRPGRQGIAAARAEPGRSCARWSRPWAGRSPPSCRCSRATAASSRRATRPRSTSSAACATRAAS